MFTEDQPLSLAHSVFMLRCEGDVTARAGSVLDRYNDPIFLIIEKSLVDVHDFWIGRLHKFIAGNFQLAPF